MCVRFLLLGNRFDIHFLGGGISKYDGLFSFSDVTPYKHGVTSREMNKFLGRRTHVKHGMYVIPQIIRIQNPGELHQPGPILECSQG